MKHYFPYILFSAITSLRCTGESPSFAVYDIDALQEAVVKNDLQSYVEYGYVDGKLEKADSVVFDDRGRISCKISKGFVDERWFTYDSLGRVVFETQWSDIYTTVRTEYELDLGGRQVVKKISLGNRGDSIGELNTIEVLKYDDALNRILKRTITKTYSDDTTLVEYQYDGNRILKEVQRSKRTTGVVTEYQYNGKSLISISRILDPIYNSTDYISPITGLMDSTINIDIMYGDTSTVYYKYYRR